MYCETVVANVNVKSKKTFMTLLSHYYLMRKEKLYNKKILSKC